MANIFLVIQYHAQTKTFFHALELSLEGIYVIG
jgi:hypothetical protein